MRPDPRAVRRSFGRVVGLASVLALGLGMGCVDSGMMHAARAGDRPALAQALAAANAKGTLSLSEAANVARAVVAAELRAAKAPDDVARVKDLRACALDVDDALAERMKGHDVAAGEAALERAEAGAIGEASARGYIASTDDRWRAVAMSGMMRDRDRDARRRGLVDGSTLVRAAALHAIVEHDDPADFAAVLEAARLDPAPFLRSTAVRALGRMAGAPSDLVNALRDLWATGDDALREDVAAVLASRAIYAAGGHEALAHLLVTARGNEAVGVAGAILGSNAPDAELRAAAATELARAIVEGEHRAAIHAIAVASPGRGESPEAAAMLGALRTASRADDLDVQLAALGRLATARNVPPADQGAAITALEAVAVPRVPALARASQARFLLAEAGDLRVQAWIEADLPSPDATVRLGAGDALAILGRASRAAPLLADADASVRTRAACTILVAARASSSRRRGRM